MIRNPFDIVIIISLIVVIPVLGFDLIRNQPKRILNNELIKTKEERIRKAKIAKYCGIIGLILGVAGLICFGIAFFI